MQYVSIKPKTLRHQSAVDEFLPLATQEFK